MKAVTDLAQVTVCGNMNPESARVYAAALAETSPSRIVFEVSNLFHLEARTIFPSSSLAIETLSLGSSNVVQDALNVLCGLLRDSASLRSLALDHCDFGDEKIDETLADALASSHLESLTLISPFFQNDDTDMRIFANAVVRIATLSSLILDYARLDDECAALIGAALASPDHPKKLQRLSVLGNNITAVGMRSLAEGLRHCNYLTALNVVGNDVGEEGMLALASLLDSSCATLRELTFGGRGMTSVGLRAVIEALVRKENLTVLHMFSDQGSLLLPDLARILNANRKMEKITLEPRDGLVIVNNAEVSTDNIRVLCDALQTSASRLDTLVMNNIVLGPETMTMLAESLTGTAPLTQLQVKGGAMSSSVANAFGEMLKRSETIRSLSIFCSSLDPGAMVGMVPGLLFNCSLRALQLGTMDLDDGGYNALRIATTICAHLDSIKIWFQEPTFKGLHQNIMVAEMIKMHHGSALFRALAKISLGADEPLEVVKLAVIKPGNEAHPRVVAITGEHDVPIDAPLTPRALLCITSPTSVTLGSSSHNEKMTVEFDCTSEVEEAAQKLGIDLSAEDREHLAAAAMEKANHFRTLVNSITARRRIATLLAAIPGDDETLLSGHLAPWLLDKFTFCK